MRLPPRIPLCFLPTPVHKLDRLRQQLNGPDLWIKRDDQTGLATGGNKARKLEFLLAEALAQKCDHLITLGGPQSNHARQTAAAAARIGVRCSLVLKGHPPSHRTGNLLLDDLLGAEIVWSGNETREAAAQILVESLKAQGRRPYLIPIGGSTGLGALGYMLAMQEALEQLKALNVEIATMVVASSSGGTQAGLALGAALFGFQGQVLGISIDASQADLAATVSTIATDAAEILGSGYAAKVLRVRVNDDYLGAGYAKVGDLERRAIRLLASTEGILLDPVYTGRAMGGFLDLIQGGAFQKNERILFWHTGGEAALSAFSADLA